MGRDELKDSLFNVVQYIAKTELSDATKKLLTHYFNDASASDSLHKAVQAIERYIQDSIPGAEERDGILEDLLNDLAYEAKQFDLE